MLSFTIITAVAYFNPVSGHGRLMEPPSRNAMWRYGYPNPVNYNDNELFCGGFIVHYGKNKGNCGVCGDDWRLKIPRPHETGGVYSNGHVANVYTMGQKKIEISAELTTNHKGWMEVKLCPRNDDKTAATIECFNDYILQLSDGSGTHFVIPQDSKKVEWFTWHVDLPPGVICSHCVLQWTYFAGNTWGQCVDGSENQGCGNQETFINCADIVIQSHSHVRPPMVDNPWTLYFKGNTHYPKYFQPPKKSNVIKDELSFRPLVIRSQLCVGAKNFTEVNGIDDWCMNHCMQYPPFCPQDRCKCVHECKAIGKLAEQEDADIFCHQNCLKYPSHCPKDKCECY